MLARAAGLAGLSTLGRSSGEAAAALWLALCGLGTGLFISPNSSSLMGAAPRARQGAAGSLLALGRNLGMLLGVVLGSSLFQLCGARTGRPWQPAEYGAFALVLRVSAAVALCGGVLSALRPRPTSGPRP